MKRKVIIKIAAVCLALVCGGVLFYNIRKSNFALGGDTQFTVETPEEIPSADVKIT